MFVRFNSLFLKDFTTKKKQVVSKLVGGQRSDGYVVCFRCRQASLRRIRWVKRGNINASMTVIIIPLWTIRTWRTHHSSINASMTVIIILLWTIRIWRTHHSNINVWMTVIIIPLSLCFLTNLRNTMWFLLRFRKRHGITYLTTYVTVGHLFLNLRAAEILWDN